MILGQQGQVIGILTNKLSLPKRGFMNTTKNDNFIWFGLSISIHTLILAAIFISLQNKPSLIHKPSQKNFSFKVPAPIIFYGHQMDPHKMPGSLSQTHQSSPQAMRQSTSPAAETVKQAAPKTIQKPKRAPEKPSVIKKEKTQTTVPAKKEPTLAEMFNQIRRDFRLPQKSNLYADGDGAGQPLVIREGDIKYYSLWSGFLKHLNNAARFNRVKNPVPLEQWLSHKLIKNHLQCGITINKKGEVQDIDIILSSGYKPYDELCIQDIWSASPFPPLPDQLGKNVARFEVRTYF